VPPARKQALVHGDLISSLVMLPTKEPFRGSITKLEIRSP